MVSAAAQMRGVSFGGSQRAGHRQAHQRAFNPSGHVHGSPQLSRSPYSQRWVFSPHWPGARQTAGLAAGPPPALAAQHVDLSQWVKESHKQRLKFLEEQSLDVLRKAVDGYSSVVFPCALIAGDVVILDLLARLDLLSSGKVPVVFIDTFHLFPETYAFLGRLEDKHGFKAQVFHAKGFKDKADFKKTHGSDLFIRDIEEYDQICKVEPFNRALEQTKADVMVNGRRRDHGFERAHLEVFEEGTPIKCNVLAWWSFLDCWNYLDHYHLERHPLHEQGFPSIGDMHSTVPVPREKWFEYAGERSGRFQGLTNPDGSIKTECGIHVEGT